MKKHAADKIGASVLSAALIMALSPMTALAASGASSFGGGTPPSMSGAGSGQMPGGGAPGGGGGGANTQTYDYSGTYSAQLTADGTTASSADETLESTTKDENVALAQNGGTLTIDGDTLVKSGDDTDGDNCNFYGVNSSVLSVGKGSLVKIANSSVSSTSEGSNGLFATDSGTIYANNDTITTTDGANSRGLDATYGGVIVANKMTISTEKDHCATVATDRGGGYISVSNSELATAGSGSPLLYSTGDIEADNVTGTATGSQIAGMEGLNKILIANSNLTSTNDAKSGSDPIKDAVILYQSTSGDADTSTSSASDFEASDSTLKTSISDGAFFYVTNTTANIVLQNDTLDFDSDKVELLHASGNSNGWGTSGSNAGNTTLTAIGQTLEGKVYADSISTATLYLTDGSKWTGAVSSTNSTGDGTTAAPSNVTVNLDGTSTWVVTGDTTVGNLNVASGGKVVDSSGNTVTIVAGGKTVVEGTSDYTLTVTGAYTADATITGAGTISSASSTLTSARASFDETYGTTTTWGANGSSSTGSDGTAGTSGSGTGTSGSGSSSSKTSTGSGTSVSSGSTASAAERQATSIVITAKTVSAKTLKAALEKKGTSASKVTTITLGRKVKTVKKSAFRAFKNLKTIIVKSKKLKKKRVKNSLKNSKVQTVKVKVSSNKKTNAKYVKRYKKYFAKANSGRKVVVKAA